VDGGCANIGERDHAEQEKIMHRLLILYAIGVTPEHRAPIAELVGWRLEIQATI
jgi:hypothetical protein